MAEDTTPETAGDDSRAKTEQFVSEVYGACRGYDPAAPTGDLRKLLADVAAALDDLGACEDPDCVKPGCVRALPRVRAALAELAADPGDLTARTAEAMRFHDVDEDRDRAVENYCACGEQVDDWEEHAARVALSVRWEHAAHLAAENARQERLLDDMSQDVDRLERALRDRTAQLATANAKAEHAEEELTSVRDHNTRWEREKARADKAEEQRDAALHSSTELGKANVEWQRSHDEASRRAVAAEAQVAALQRKLDAASDKALINGRLHNGGQVSCDDVTMLQRDAEAKRDAAYDQVAALQRELAEARTVMGLVRLEADKLAGVPGGGTVRKVLADRLHAILPFRPDDPTEIRRLAQATTESTEEKR